jgi:hypothetical protein
MLNKILSSQKKSFNNDIVLQFRIVQSVVRVPHEVRNISSVIFSLIIVFLQYPSDDDSI